VRNNLIKIFCFVTAVAFISILSGCGTERSEFDKGYDLGSSDIAKRQYWAIQNLQKQKSNLQKGYGSDRYKVVSIPVSGKAQDGSNISDHYVNVRVIDR
jgi:hypothetical protein